jgi:hypothetical protein
LIGRRDRRAAYAVVAALVAAAFAFPALAAADAPEDGAVLEFLAPSASGWGTHWTKQELEEAKPLPVITLPGPEAPMGPEAPAAEPSEAARTAALGGAVLGQTAATEGIEVPVAESVSPPNSANGTLFGKYLVEGKIEKYSCSGSVVQSTHGDVVVTAGHCVIEPETGAKTQKGLTFIPGYRNGTAPYGEWQAEYFTATETWLHSATKGSYPNEGGDVAFLNLRKNEDGEDVEDVVGALGIDFDQSCNQTYTQFGYPAEAPYNGNVLYSHTASYAGPDTNPLFSPVPLKIASDFTRGASGGPWAIGVGTEEPTALSVTAYGYENQPGFLYGPYFGEAAKKAYGIAVGHFLPAGIEETCAALPPPPPTPPTPTPPAPTPTPAPEATPVVKPVTLKVTRVRRRANGSAVLTAKVNTAGILQLSGTAVRGESLGTPAAGRYRLVVAPKGRTTRRLRQVGKAKVGVKVAFSASGKTKSVSRKIRLSRPSVARAAQRRPSGSR